MLLLFFPLVVAVCAYKGSAAATAAAVFPLVVAVCACKVRAVVAAADPSLNMGHCC